MWDFLLQVPVPPFLHLHQLQQESSSMDGRTFGRGRRGPDRRGWRGTSPGERPSSGSPTAPWPSPPRERGKLCLCGLSSPLWLEIDIIKGASTEWHLAAMYLSAKPGRKEQG